MLQVKKNNEKTVLKSNLNLKNIFQKRIVKRYLIITEKFNKCFKMFKTYSKLIVSFTIT